MARSISEKKSESPFPFYFFSPSAAGKFPLICMTPLLGRLILFEDLFWERRFARFFAENGFAVLLIDRPIFNFDPQQGLEQIQHYIEISIKRNKTVLDFVLAENLPIHLDAIGSFGISFGAIINTLWASQDNRLKTHIFALGGGNLPKIFMTSRDPLMQSYLNAARESTGLADSDLEAQLLSIFKHEPLSACRSLKPDNTLMIIALFDRVIRFKFASALRRALNFPRTVFLPLGHYTTILAIPFLKPLILSFFKDRLNSRCSSEI